MPYSPSITSFNALPPALIRSIHVAFDDAIGAIESNSRVPMDARAAVARRIVELAKHGECDVVRLREVGLAAVVSATKKARTT
jgi:hypothetical protein